MAANPRERILEATYVCVGRYGLGKTTVEDAAKEAGLSRATVYRYFPGGKEELTREVIAWEATRFLARLGDAVAAAVDLPSLLEHALLFAHRAVAEHEVLQKVLQTEPDRLLPTLTTESFRLRDTAVAFLLPRIDPAQLRPGLTAEAAADYMARMLLSFISAPGRWDLTDPAQVRELVHTELLAGVLRPGA